MATFVLIPGGFTGSWIWQPVTTLLRAAGHTVYPVTVTGLGERVHLATPEIGLDTHIQDIVNVLIYEDLHDVILAGWSYGATLAACVAHRAPARIQHVVYVDGDPPKDGQSALDRMMPDERAMVEERFRTEGDGFRIPPRTGAYPEMIPDTALRAWVIDRLTPDLIATWTQPVRLGNDNAHQLPCTTILFVGDEPDRFVTEVREQVQDTPNWRLRELEASHFGIVTRPQEVVALLGEVAAAVPGSTPR